MSENTSRKRKLTRRAFMITGGILGTGLIVGAAGLVTVNKRIRKYSGIGMGEGSSLNAWVRIAPDNTITVAVPRSEMGQGVYTSLPQLVAEELEVPMSSIKVVHPQAESPYANTYMLSQEPPNFFDGYNMNEKLFSYLTLVATGGSTAIPDGFLNMRYAGATAREMLRRAAAKRWGVPVKDCEARGGFMINRSNQERLAYGDLAEAAAEIELKKVPELKNRSEWKIAGKSVARLDIPEKVNGTAEFSIDVRPEGVLYAALRHPEVVGGAITGVRNRAEIEKRPGVKKVVLTKYGAAVIADNTWRARNAVLALNTIEDSAGNEQLDSDQIARLLDETLDQAPIATPEVEGDVEAAFADPAGKMLEARYGVPYLAHAAMEPLNCTVLVEEDRAEAWVGHQSVSGALNALAKETGIKKANIRTHITYLGGGFGRRGEVDYVLKAAAVAKEMKGTPIMTVFTREEDMRNDMYRPAVASKLKAVVDETGSIRAWDHMLATQSVMAGSLARMIPPLPAKPKNDVTTVEGAQHLPYHMENRRVAFGDLDLPIQVGFWRSVGSSQNAFFTECFLDECAHAADMDPYEFRRQKLDAQPRFKKTLEKVAEISNWGEHLPENTYRGIALHKSFGSIVAEVAEITRRGEKEFSIDKFYAAIDCGTYVNPNTIEAQLQGGIIFGLTAALYGEITWGDGAVEQYNFPQYEMVRMPVAPTVQIAILENEAYPGGVGEPGTPPAAPALVNALFAATGERVRSLPLVKQGYTFV